MTFKRVQYGAPVGDPYRIDPRKLKRLAEQKAERDAKGLKALKNLAGFATDAEDFRMLAEALGLDLELLKEEGA